MALQNVAFTTHFARRIPDPVFFRERAIERHFFFVPVREVPLGLPLDPNARIPNVRRTVYKEVKESLLSKDGMFHMKHKGITLVADSVKKHSDTQYTVRLGEGHGILDGGHTYTLITDPKSRSLLPENQFVKFEILTNVPSGWIADIAGGLNTSVQVQDMSLDNLKGDFNWLKKVIAKESYADEIAWRENEDGAFDARDLISILTCFNIDLFPNDVSDTQPVIAYEKKSAALKLFEDRPESYERLAPIVKDILYLHDFIRADARNQWNDEGGSFGKLAFVERKQEGFFMPFTEEESEYRLMSGALYPILAAFRWRVEVHPKKGTASWRGGFKSVLRLWNDSAIELLKMTQQASVELGRNPNAIGKSRNHWANLFARVAMRDLLSGKAGSPKTAA